MKTSDALKLILIYKNMSEEDAQKYMASLSTFETHFIAYPIKSLRFDNNESDYKKLADLGDSLEGEVKGLGVISVAQYGVRDEEPERYAYYSDKYPTPLFIRLFDLPKTYSSFKNNPKITILESIPFMGAEILRYHSSNSTDERYAVFSAEDVALSDSNFQEFRENLAKREVAETTKVFSV